MPFAELVTPSLKQDDVTRDMILNHKSALLAPIITSTQPGDLFSGLMIMENGINVESELKFVLGLEWKSQEQFSEFLASEKFKAFGGSVKPLALAPPQPQLYETDISPKPVFSAPITEAFRIVKNENGDEIERYWKDFTIAVQKITSGVRSFSGWSVNLENETFAGVVGWDNLEVRERTFEDPKVVPLRGKLETMQGSTSFLVKLSLLN